MSEPSETAQEILSRIAQTADFAKILLNPDGTIQEKEAHRVERVLRAHDVEARVDRTHNVLVSGTIRLGPAR